MPRELAQIVISLIPILWTSSMTMLTTLDPEAADFNTVQEKLEAVGKDLGVQVIIQREDVFQYMYKI